MTIKGEPDDGGTDHIMECPVCGMRFDMRDLGQVFEHEHDGAEMPAMIFDVPPPKSRARKHKKTRDPS
jgi:hypothetical protein